MLPPFARITPPLLLAISLLVTSAAVAQSVRGEAQTSARRTGRGDATAPLLPVRLEGHLGLTWDGELGAGARAEISVLDRGLLANTRDELAVSLGLDVLFLAIDGSDPRTFYPTAALQWTLGVNEHVAFFPEFGLIGVFERSGWEGVLPTIGFGARYYVWRSISGMARLGWPIAISAGVTF